MNVANPIMSRVTTSMGLRPMRSPKCPNIAPPNGRATKPTPKVAKESKVPIRGVCSVKNTCGKTSAAAVP
jgi:hypothetical protein